MTKEGRTKTEQAVERLKTIGVEPTHIFCSPLTRTQQTTGSAFIGFHKKAMIEQGILEWWIPPAQLQSLRKG